MKRAAILAALALLVGAAWPIYAQEAADLEAAFAYLPGYTFGNDRGPLTTIEAGLRAAVADPAQSAALEERLLAVLTGQGTVDAQRWVCRQLEVYGTAKSVSALAAALDNPDIGPAALWALENVPGTEADAALAKAAQESSGAVQIGVIQALGRRGEEAPLAILLTALKPDVAAAAAEALGKMGDEQALSRLFQARAVAQGAVRTAVDSALLDCLSKLTKPCANGLDKSVLEALVSAGNPAHVRSAALSGLVKAEPKKALERVLAALGDEDADYAHVAIGFIPELPGEAATQAFAARLEGLAPNAQTSLVQALAARGDRAAGPAVQALATSENEDVQLTALEALGVLGSAETTVQLLDIAAHGSAKASRTSRDSLDRLNAKGANDALLAALKDGAPELRAEAAGALGRRLAAEAKPAVLAAVSDEDNSVRDAALKALRLIGEPGDIPALLDLFAQDAYAEQREGIQSAVVAIAARIQPAEKQADAVLARLNGADAALRAALLGVAGQIPTPASLEALRAALADADGAVRTAALSQLGRWPDAAPLENLWNSVTAAQDPAEKALAFDGFLRLLRDAGGMSDVERAGRYAAAADQAAGAAQLKQVLSGVSALACIEALELAKACQANGEAAAEAAFATIKVAGSIAGAYPEEARAALAPFTAETADAALKEQAAAVLERMNCAGGFITAWELSGPYVLAGKNAHLLFSESFAPETDPDAAAWRIAPMSAKPGQCWLVDLAALLGGNERVAYLRTRIHAAEALDATLALGSNDGVKAWLNNALVHEANVGRGIAQDQDKVAVHLEAGWNTLLLAIFQQGGDWQGCARLLDASGNPLANVQYAVVLTD